MPHVKSNYTIFARKLKSGKVYYFQTYDENGRRLPARSTGMRTRSEARQFCDGLLKAERLTAPDCPTLAEWVQDRHFYEWDEDSPDPKCLYALGRLARSSPDRPAVQRHYIEECSRKLRKYILPKFGKYKINLITPAMLEKWMFGLREKGLSAKTTNNISSAFRIITSEAQRLALIVDDPWKRVPMLSPDSKYRGSLDTSEALLLMDPRTIDTVWLGHELYYLLSLTAMLTGCRQGEILATQRKDWHSDHLDVFQGWKPRSKELGPTKTKVRAPVAIPEYLYNQVMNFCKWEGFVFSFNGGKSPATGNRATEAFNEALGRIGIDEEQRIERGIKFHGWRKFCNTYLRGMNISDPKIRAQTRHATEEMTDHYTTWNAEDFTDVRKALEDLTRKIEKLEDPKK